MIAWIRGRGFLLAILLAVGGALLWPQLGARGGPLATEWSVPLVIFCIFLLQGLSLPTRKLLAGGGNARIHAFVHLWCYLGYPALAFLLIVAAGPLLAPAATAGLIFLAILPSTIFSALGCTQAAGGNTAAALVNTVSTNLIGVIAVPLLAMLLLQLDSFAVSDPLATIRRLALLILFPLVLGQLVRNFWRKRAESLSRHHTMLSNAGIVFIIFAAVADSISGGYWQSVGGSYLLQVSLAALALLALSHLLIALSLPWVGRAREDRIAAFFCASQKTLATGIPMAIAIFSDAGTAGLIVIPLILYHPLQLVVAAFVVQWLQSPAVPSS